MRENYSHIKSSKISHKCTIIAFKDKLFTVFLAAFTGCVIFTLPYIIFIRLADNSSSGPFLTFLMLVSLLLSATLLKLVGLVSGRIVSNANFDNKDIVLFILAIPGLYIGLSGFVINYIIDGYIPIDGFIALTFMAIATTIIPGSAMCRF